MPRYDYKCEKNGHVFEVVQSFNDEPVAFCPEDGSKAERMFSVPHVIYKGSGFYTTDYGSSSNGKSSSSSSSNSDESKSSKSESKSSDTKSKSDSKSKSSSSKSK